MSLRFEKATSIQQMDSGGGSGGQTINNQDLTITENGVYTADEGYTGIGEAVVNVNQSVQDKTITTNGTYTADSGYIGIGTATVNVQPNLISKSINENGTYTPGVGVDGYNEVVVNVPVPQPTLIAKTITENGTYIASDDNADGYSSVTANVPRGGLQTSVAIAPSFTATLGSIVTTATVE